jgi:prepilin-type N-terminal cleavage/methylation domain-containing protein
MLMMSKGLYNQQSGFTLIEIAVVLVIIGVLIGGFIGTFTDRIETTRRDNTRQQLEDVRTAILGYASAEGRLPCPTRAIDGGVAQPVAGGVCTQTHGFVPARTIGLSGAYNSDNLLIDSWGNPIRYSVTIANSSAFTKPVGTGNGGIRDIGMATLNPNITICDGDSTSASSCVGSNEIVSNAPFVIISLGKDGADFIAATAPNSDQGENAGEATVSAFATGENIVYTVGDNRVFVSKSYSSVDSVAGQFDDLILWTSPYVFYGQMIEAGQLP